MLCLSYRGLLRQGVDLPSGDCSAEFKILLFDGCNYRPLLFTNPLFRGLFHF